MIFAKTNLDFMFLVYVWGGVLLLFMLFSLYVWVKGNNIKNKLKKENNGVSLFSGIEFHRLAKSKIAYNVSIPVKIDVAIDENYIYLLPGKFRIFLFNNLVPSQLNRKNTSLILEPQFSKSIRLNLDSSSIENKMGVNTFFGKIKFECTLTCIDTDQRDKIISLTK